MKINRKHKDQLELLNKQPKSYGGELLRTRKGRSQPRPLDTRNSMHLVLRSSKAVGKFSFKNPINEAKIAKIVADFAYINGITIYSMANVGNHLHLQIKLSNRHTYKPFIRAITSAIAMAVTGINRWTKKDLQAEAEAEAIAEATGTGTATATATEVTLKTPFTKSKFWDYRPFTRVVMGYQAFLKLRDYVQINVLEGFGCQRHQARMIWEGQLKSIYSSG